MLLIPSISLSIFFLVHLLFFPTSHADIPLGSTLTPSKPNTNWASPKNSFSLNFIPIPSTNPTSFSAAICFYRIPVWKAGGDAGVVDSSARIELLLNGNLRLTNGSGGMIWESRTSNQGVTTATLDDSGNLCLKNGTTTIWSSFENPTDTILPSQNFTTSNSLQSGSYSFNLLGSGNITLRWNRDIVYWNQGVKSSLTGSLSSPTLTLLQTGILQLSDSSFSVPVVMDYSSDYGEGSDVLRFLRLDSDGNLRIYSSIRGSGTYTEGWAAVLDQCRVYGFCGNMGICSYNDSMPVCSCPAQNFEFSDPSNTRKGCKRKVEIENCPGNTTMWQLDQTQFLTYPPELSSQVFHTGISACRLNCLVGGSCVASTTLADGTGICYLKESKFISGYQSPALPSTSFVKICAPVLPISHTKIPLGSTLTPSSPNINWTSPNNVFSVGFIPISYTHPTSFSASITFGGIPAWKAGGDTGVVDSSASFELLLDGNLRLTNGSGVVLWESGTSYQGVSIGTLDDWGNLSLKNGLITIWSSFENPTDTILPNQNLTSLKSLQSGSYSFILLDSGGLALRWKTNIIYWSQALHSSYIGNGNLSSPTLRLLQIGILQLLDSTFSAPVDLAYSSDYGEVDDVLRFLKLDSDGNLRIYSSDRGSGTTTEKWAAVLDQCRVFGFCGNMGICSYNDSMPVCGCPSQNFEFLDPYDSKRGCKRKVEIEDCPSGVVMLQLDHTLFFSYAPELFSELYYVGISGCNGNCLQGGSSCVVSTSLADGTGQCYLKGSKFASGYQSWVLPSTSFVKVCFPALPNPSLSSATMNQINESRIVPAWLVVLGSLAGLVLLEVGMWFLCCKRSSIGRRRLSTEYSTVQNASSAPIPSSSIELQRPKKESKQ